MGLYLIKCIVCIAYPWFLTNSSLDTSPTFMEQLHYIIRYVFGCPGSSMSGQFRTLAVVFFLWPVKKNFPCKKVYARRQHADGKTRPMADKKNLKNHDDADERNGETSLSWCRVSWCRGWLCRHFGAGGGSGITSTISLLWPSSKCGKIIFPLLCHNRCLFAQL